jgi:hypothetical protein
MIDETGLAPDAEQRIWLNSSSPYHRVRVVVEPRALQQPVRNRKLAPVQLRIVKRRCR